jgi:hypothetical protein
LAQVRALVGNQLERGFVPDPMQWARQIQQASHAGGLKQLAHFKLSPFTQFVDEDMKDRRGEGVDPSQKFDWPRNARDQWGITKGAVDGFLDHLKGLNEALTEKRVGSLRQEGVSTIMVNVFDNQAGRIPQANLTYGVQGVAPGAKYQHPRGGLPWGSIITRLDNGGFLYRPEVHFPKAPQGVDQREVYRRPELWKPPAQEIQGQLQKALENKQSIQASLSPGVFNDRALVVNLLLGPDGKLLGPTTEQMGAALDSIETDDVTMRWVDAAEFLQVSDLEEQLFLVSATMPNGKPLLSPREIKALGAEKLVPYAQRKQAEINAYKALLVKAGKEIPTDRTGQPLNDGTIIFLFGRRDTNLDGFITPDESQRHFAELKLDTNGDGKVSMDEFYR